MSRSTTETNFSNQKEYSPDRKKIIAGIVEIIIIVIISLFILYFLIPIIHKYVANYSTAEVIAISTLILTIGRCVFNMGRDILRNCNATKKSIALTVEAENEYTIITCKIANRDTRRIKPKDIYLFLERGIHDGNGPARFPFLLCHENGNKDCALGAICKLQDRLTEFPDHIIKEEEFKKISRQVFRLSELCQEGRHYIDPGEEFSEDVSLVFQEGGVYRATVIWTSENDDCICASKQFTVIKSAKTPSG